MASMSQVDTSNIHQLPVRPRRQQAAVREAQATVTELYGPPLARMEFGSAWYHEAAMLEEVRRDEH